MNNIQAESSTNEIAWEIPCSENRLKTFKKSKLLLLAILSTFSILIIIYGLFINEYAWCYTGLIFLIGSVILILILKLKPKKYQLNNSEIIIVSANKEKKYKWSVFRSYNLNNPYGDYNDPGGSDLPFILALFMPLDLLLYNFGAEKDDKFFYLDIGLFKFTQYVKIQVDAKNIEIVEKFLDSKLPKK